MKIKKRILRNLVLLPVVLLAMVSCEKVNFEINGVSFNKDIQTIFNDKCTKCHPPNKGLDLTSEFAYNNIVPKYASAADSTNPEASKLYLKLIGSHDSRCTDIQKEKIKIWISQGVPNN